VPMVQRVMARPKRSIYLRAGQGEAKGKELLQA
jgi:hypothetical protein